MIKKIILLKNLLKMSFLILIMGCHSRKIINIWN
jgi:hypothetical protein